jgi:hypothetical protein
MGRAGWALSDGELLVRLDGLTAEVARLVGLQAQAVREVEARGVPAAQGVTGMVRWLQERYRCSPRAARRLVELGRLLDQRPALETALSSGSVHVEQVEAIGTAVGLLAAEPQVSADLVDKAEAALVEQAAVFAPKPLQQLGWRVLAHVAPEVADRVDAAVLARQEARGRAMRTFQLTSMGDGRVRCTGWLDVEGAAIVNAALDPLCGLRRTRTLAAQATPETAGAAVDGTVVDGTAVDGAAVDSAAVDGTVVDGAAVDGAAVDGAAGGALAGGAAVDGALAGGALAGGAVPGGAAGVVTPTGDDRTPGQRRADALVDICRLALHTGELPAHGGDRPQLVVTVPFDLLRKELGAGQLDGGEQLTPAQVRQLACDAQILPAVLGGDSQVLDHGRSRRLVTGPLRRALVLRDRGCVWPGCHLPARHCEAHHLTPWHRGGTTCLTNLALLCPAHHHLAERQGWTIRIAADGHPELTAPEWLDPTRRPRRNTYHRRC